MWQIWHQKYYPNRENENAQKGRFAYQDLCYLPTTFYLAKKMGKSVGRSKILL